MTRKSCAAGTLSRLSAFAEVTGGGNPAGVWVGDELPDEASMQKIAAEVAYSETAFLAPLADRVWRVRYFSPKCEVTFCGHATIAAGAVLAKGETPCELQLETPVGRVPLSVRRKSGRVEVSLTSVTPSHELADETTLTDILGALRWRREDLDASIPPARIFAGAWHLVLAVKTQRQLASLEYAFQSLRQLMLREDLATLQLIWRESVNLFHSRNPFPVGGVVEDPATGAAAAALGGYLRDAGLLETPAILEVRQGETMGRPSVITVNVPKTGGITITGSVVEITGP